MSDRIRFVVLNRDGGVVHRYPSGCAFRWDFTIPGPLQGGRIIDLWTLPVTEREQWLSKPLTGE